MPTNTYVALATQTLSSATSTVTFSSIPSGYTDLVLVASLRADAVTYNNMNFPILRLNGDSTSGLYSVTNLYSRNTGSGDTANSGRASSQNEINFGGVVTTNMTSGIFSTWIAHFFNYSNTTTNKTILNRIASASNLTTSDGTSAGVGLWRNTAAINSITLNPTSSGNFTTGSTFSLYGIKSEEAAAKATGGMVTSDANYYYHTFTASGTFTPKQALSCDYLVVAGGGGGGGTFAYQEGSGGGGAGGLRSTIASTGGGGTVESQLSVASGTAYTVTVGAGGSGGDTSGTRGSSGSNSVFSTVTSTGGGGGGASGPTSTTTGIAGGAGGGAGGLGTAGAGTTNQGFAGGAATGVQHGGGGGGASAVGFAGGVSSGGGGAAVSNSISGSSINYAGGGGGGGTYTGGANPTGGTGGSGAGNGGNGNSGNGGTATVNLGGGGGGASGYTSSGGNGGSGIVIVRYAK